MPRPSGFIACHKGSPGGSSAESSAGQGCDRERGLCGGKVGLPGGATATMDRDTTGSPKWADAADMPPNHPP